MTRPNAALNHRVLNAQRLCELRLQHHRGGEERGCADKNQEAIFCRLAAPRECGLAQTAAGKRTRVSL